MKTEKHTKKKKKKKKKRKRKERVMLGLQFIAKFLSQLTM